MTAIPEQQQLTPEQAFELLQAWYQQSAQLAALEQTEFLARQRMAGFYFPGAEEGTNRMDLGGGFDLLMQQTINRNVDEAALFAVTPEQVAKLKLPMDELFKQSWSLSTTAYRNLNAAQTKFIDALLDIKEGSPKLSIVPKADTAGQAKHAAAADAANAPQYDINTGKEDDTTPGQYFKDADGVWWLLDSDEWKEVTTMATLEGLEAQITAPKKTRKPRAKKS